MRIVNSRQVMTHHVEFTAEETQLLQELGWFPQGAQSPARLWLQDEQITEWKRLLEERVPYPR